MKTLQISLSSVGALLGDRSGSEYWFRSNALRHPYLLSTESDIVQWQNMRFMISMLLVQIQLSLTSVPSERRKLQFLRNEENFCDRLPRCNITEGASPLHKIFASPMALPKYFVP
jgi:hypothetical protein